MQISALVFLISILPLFIPVYAATYYEEQSNFDEDSVPLAEYRWNIENIQVCIFKEDDIPNKYYVWAKLAVQDWRNALREYTDSTDIWNINARYVDDKRLMTDCDVKVYIYETYRDFPEYPSQAGAYTAVRFSAGIADDASIYLSPIVLHGDGSTEIDLPGYAFRNSAVHEMGHVLGLGHNEKPRGYLMSPQFDFWEENDQLPITNLELSTLISVYGRDGFIG